MYEFGDWDHWRRQDREAASALEFDLLCQLECGKQATWGARCTSCGDAIQFLLCDMHASRVKYAPATQCAECGTVAFGMQLYEFVPIRHLVEGWKHHV